MWYAPYRTNKQGDTLNILSRRDTPKIEPGQRVLLQFYYDQADKHDKPCYLGTFRKLLSDGYGVIDWDAGFQTEEYIGFREKFGYDDSDIRFVGKA